MESGTSFFNRDSLKNGNGETATRIDGEVGSKWQSAENPTDLGQDFDSELKRDKQRKMHSRIQFIQKIYKEL